MEGWGDLAVMSKLQPVGYGVYLLQDIEWPNVPYVELIAPWQTPDILSQQLDLIARVIPRCLTPVTVPSHVCWCQPISDAGVPVCKPLHFIGATHPHPVIKWD